MKLKEILNEEPEFVDFTVEEGPEIHATEDLTTVIPDDIRDRINLLRCEDIKSLMSLKGCPEKIHLNIIVERCENLRSLEYAPMEVVSSAYFFDTNIQSLAGIGKNYLRKIGKYLYLPDSIKSNILGLFLIKGVDTIHFDDNNEYENNKPLHEVINIFYRVRRDGEGLLECKEELMNAGLKEYAKL